MVYLNLLVHKLFLLSICSLSLLLELIARYHVVICVKLINEI